MKNLATIGVIGGSGFYNLFDNYKEIDIRTPYGKPSDKIRITKFKGINIAFLPRHGRDHQFPPHLVPYKANILALKKIGVKIIIAPTASGSLKKYIKPGNFVFCDQFVNFTSGRNDTYFEGLATKQNIYNHKIVHISSDKPYCQQLRSIAFRSANKLKFKSHKNGTAVIINGPRFSTTAESNFYAQNEWSVINMTQYPEVILAREMQICYLNISLITDYDVGIRGKNNIKPVTTSTVLSRFKKNNEKLKELIQNIVVSVPLKYSCSCHNSLEEAIVN